MIYIFLILAVVFYFLVWAPKRGAQAPSPSPYSGNSPNLCPQYQKGQHWNVDPDGEVPIIRSKEGVASDVPVTVMKAFRDGVGKIGDNPALFQEIGETQKFKSWTWKEYLADSELVARALIKVGMKRHESVNIIGFNSPEWFFSLLGAQLAGGKGVGIYTTNAPEACEFIAKHSDCPVVVVEGVTQLDKFVEIEGNLPNLKAIVVYNGPEDGKIPKAHRGKTPIYTWEEFLDLGVDEEGKLAEEQRERENQTKPGHCCSLIYTSGTTGNPKAVMISHDNAIWTAKSLVNIIPGLSNERVVSYLPLSHVAAQLEDVYTPIFCASRGIDFSVYFARPTALKGTLGVTLQACRPTIFFGVPRVWEKMQEKMTQIGAETKGLKKKIATWAKSLGAVAFKNRQVGGSGDLPAGYNVADKVVFSKIRDKLGFNETKIFLTGAAPIKKETLEYFGALGIAINEVYGMSENTGPATISVPSFHKVGSCGPVISGTEIKIDHVPERDQPGEGEVCFRGRHIMMGYMKEADKTREAIDEEGFMHSGDVGKFDEEGMLYITGRIKELIITAGGENIAPVPIENAILRNLSALSCVMMVGDKRKFNSLLVTIKCEPTADGGFNNILDGDAKKVNPNISTLEEAINDKTWQEYIQKGIDEYNKHSVSRAQKIQKFKILPDNFTVGGGELTPTLKLKRPVVTRKYADVIEGFYA